MYTSTQSNSEPFASSVYVLKSDYGKQPADLVLQFGLLRSVSVAMSWADLRTLRWTIAEALIQHDGLTAANPLAGSEVGNAEL